MKRERTYAASFGMSYIYISTQDLFFSHFSCYFSSSHFFFLTLILDLSRSTVTVINQKLEALIKHMVQQFAWLMFA